MGSKTEYEARKAAKRAKRAAEQAAYQAAGLARLTPLIIMAKNEHPIGDMVLSRIFPEHQDSHCIGFCVTVEPGRIIAQRERGTDDTDDGYVSIRIRGAIRLEVGEVVHATLLKRVGSHALRCLKRVLYPRIILPDGWREAVPTNQGSPALCVLPRPERVQQALDRPCDP